MTANADKSSTESVESIDFEKLNKLLLIGNFAEAARLSALLVETKLTIDILSVIVRSMSAVGKNDDIIMLLKKTPTTAKLTPVDFRVLSADAIARDNKSIGVLFACAAAALCPYNSDYWTHLGSILAHCSFLRESLIAVDRAIAIDPNIAAAYRIKSAILAMLGRPVAAIDVSEKAIELDTLNVDYRIHAAGLLINEGQPHRALFHLAFASSQDATNHVLWRLVSASYLSINDYNSAIRAAERAANLSVMHIEFRDNIVINFGSGGKGVKAPVVASLDKTFEMSPNLIADLRSSASAKSSVFTSGLANQVQIIWALLLREIRTTYSHSSLSYIWALVEPTSHLALLYALFVVVGHTSRPPLGDNMLVFYFTGLLPYLCFAHGTEKSMHAVSANINLLMLPKITTTDIVVSRIILSVMTDFVVLAIVFAIFGALGFLSAPNNYLDMFTAYGLLWVLTLGCGLTCTVISSYASWFEKIWPTFLRMQYFTCGIFYHPSGMPDWALHYLTMNPILHVLEFFRQGYYADYRSPYLDKLYLGCWAFFMLAIGLTSERICRRHLREAL